MASPEVTALQSLLRGEISACESYALAMQSLRSDSLREKARLNHSEHQEAANLLRLHIRQLGATPEETTGAWGTFASTVDNAASLLGDGAIVQALIQGEETGITSYDNAVKDESLPLELRTLIRTKLLPQTREHISSLTLTPTS